MAGFEVIIYGRFWVTAKGIDDSCNLLYRIGRSRNPGPKRGSGPEQKNGPTVVFPTQ